MRCCNGSYSGAISSFRYFWGSVSLAFMPGAIPGGKTFFRRLTVGNSFSMSVRRLECVLKRSRNSSIWLRGRSVGRYQLSEIDNILDNIGLPYSALNTQHLTNGTLGAGDGDILVSLKPDHGPTANYVRALRTQSAPHVSRSDLLYPPR